MKKRRRRRNIATQPKQKPLNVVFCVPGNKFSRNFLTCWTNLVGFCYLNNINPMLSSAYNSNVYYVRNLCLRADERFGKDQPPFQGKIDYDYIMWIDSDMVFKPEDFTALINMKVDIATGIYKMADGELYSTVKICNDEYFLKNGHYEFLTDKLLEKEEDVFEVDYNGLGWMLVKRGVYENLDYPWFRPSWENIGKDIRTFTSEDVGFCRQAIKAGYRIYANKKIIIGHEKSCIL